MRIYNTLLNVIYGMKKCVKKFYTVHNGFLLSLYDEGRYNVFRSKR